MSSKLEWISFGQDSETPYKSGECALLTTHMADLGIETLHSLLLCQLKVYVVLTKLVQERERVVVFLQMNKPNFIIIERGWEHLNDHST